MVVAIAGSHPGTWVLDAARGVGIAISESLIPSRWLPEQLSQGAGDTALLTVPGAHSEENGLSDDACSPTGAPGAWNGKGPAVS